MPLVYVDLGSNQGNMEVLLDGEGRGSFFFSLRDHRTESYAGGGRGGGHCIRVAERRWPSS